MFKIFYCNLLCGYYYMAVSEIFVQHAFNNLYLKIAGSKMCFLFCFVFPFRPSQCFLFV